MFYRPGKDAHGLPHDPFKSCVIPRPIGWISTLSTDGIANLAPFSQFQNLSYQPPYVMFSANKGTDARQKDSVVNAEASGEFVWNMATYELRDAVNKSAQDVPPEVDEFELAGLEKAPSKLVKAPRVAQSPVHFECAYHMTIGLPGPGNVKGTDMVIGRVLGIHVDDDALTADGRIDVLRLRPIARLGYYDYTSIESIFQMIIPGHNPSLLAGLEGQTSGPPAKD